MRRERTEEECVRRVARAARSRRTRRMAMATAFWVVIGVGTLGVWLCGLSPKWLNLAMALGNTASLALTLGGGWWRDRSLAACVTGLKDPEFLPDVISLLDTDCGSQTQQASIRKVAELLPLVSPPALRLGDKELALLRSWLAGPPRGIRADYCVAALTYLAEVGYVEALDVAERLADEDLKPQALEAARRCRDRLLQIQADAERSGALLRPADAPAGETLLRPAEPAPEEQLLRAVDGAQE